MFITNINGTSQLTCGCGSWLKHWETYSGQTVAYCPVVGCYNKDLVGAHVQKAYDYIDRNWYIYPLCNAHNQSSGVISVPDTYKLVSANKSETCESALGLWLKSKRV
jgi:hypothetical protein